MQSGSTVIQEAGAALRRRRAPSEAQLAYLADLCRRRGVPMPPDLTRAEAHRLINRLKAGRR